jgi:hypothetical protein
MCTSYTYKMQLRNIIKDTVKIHYKGNAMNCVMN